jgi:hypothetical protein
LDRGGGTGLGTDDSVAALGFVKRFGSVTVLNGVRSFGIECPKLGVVDRLSLIKTFGRSRPRLIVQLPLWWPRLCIGMI